MLNKVILIGRMTKDPDMRTTQSGVPVTRFTLAVDRRFKNQNGERQADFISCQAWRQTAEFIAKYFQKGSKLAVVGSIQTGSYEKNGQTIYTTDVVVDEAYFVESRQQQSPEAAERRAIQNEPAPASQPPTQSDWDNTALPFDL
jgi:single-strand DNA-binding protein